MKAEHAEKFKTVQEKLIQAESDLKAKDKYID